MIPTHVTSLLLTGQASKAVDSCPCGPNIASSQSCQSGLLVLKSASWCQKGRSIELLIKTLLLTLTGQASYSCFMSVCTYNYIPSKLSSWSIEMHMVSMRLRASDSQLEPQHDPQVLQVRQLLCEASRTTQNTLTHAIAVAVLRL
jgi:hypothetical protein